VAADYESLAYAANWLEANRDAVLEVCNAFVGPFVVHARRLLDFLQPHDP
jgi:hypothetical protein